MSKRRPNATSFCLLAAIAMAYGWAYRGTVGFEEGAMVPGALLGLTLSLGSGRPDWQGRAAIAGLFGSIGWAWGGSLSYMEQTLYVLSGSFPDVLYGYAMLFFLGALWAGIGAGILGLAWTAPISVLEGLIRPFTAVSAGLLASYLCFFFKPGWSEALETLSLQQFHRTAWLAAAITLVVSSVYWLLRRKDRSGAALLFQGAAAWWLGYLAFTKFGGLRLAPLHRSEGWGGLVGVLSVLLIYLKKRHNRAALSLCMYGVLGGGLAFPLAVFLRHPIAIHWGPFRGNWPHWRFAETSFGFFMGLAIALAALRLIRGGLASPNDDRSPTALNVYAVFVMLVVINWMNFRHHAAPLLARSAASAPALFPGVAMWIWFVFAGALVTIPVLYSLYRYLCGNRMLTPPSAFGKGTMVTLLILWITLAGYTLQDNPNASNIAGHMLLWIPAVAATLLLLSGSSPGLHDDLSTAPSDSRWRTGGRYWILWGITPVFLLCITSLSVAMQTGSLEGSGRKRFGPDAYWRQTANLMGTWHAIGMKQRSEDANMRTTDLPLTSLTFKEDRSVTAVLAGGRTDSMYQWFLKNQYIWLRARRDNDKRSGTKEMPMEFRGQQFSIRWPNSNGEAILIFQRVSE